MTIRRIQALLNRGAALGFALEKWERAGLWVLTRADMKYPNLLKQRLGTRAPAVLFGCGNKDLLNTSAIAVVGSRSAKPDDISFATRIGRRAAECDELVVSGGAAGIDRAAMLEALIGNGTAVGVLSENLLRAATATEYRKYIMSGNLALISPFNPEAHFLVANAMARNKYIYCLAKEAIVVCSTPDRGGTWQGAIENLRKGWVPLRVKRTSSEESGNPRLVELGGYWLEDVEHVEFGKVSQPQNIGEETHTHLGVASESPDMAKKELSLDGDQLNTQVEEKLSLEMRKTTSKNHGEEYLNEALKIDPKEKLYATAKSLTIKICREPTGANAIADALGVTKPTADAWLKRLVEERVLKKISRPIRYVTCEKDLLELD